MRNLSEKDRRQEDIIYVMWTSGSTGSAKAVCGTATGESPLYRALAWMTLLMNCLTTHNTKAYPLEWPVAEYTQLPDLGAAQQT